MNIGVEKVDIHERVIVKVLLNSGATGIFMDRRTAAKYGFKLQRLERSIPVRNINGTDNSREAITHQVEANMYYKGHVDKMWIDVYNLGKTEVILGIL